MQLEDILNGIKFKAICPINNIEIDRITCDSRSVRPNDMFIAFRGYAMDGSRFINDAIANGAGIILAEKDFAAPANVKKILIDDSRLALPIIADNFYGHPSGKLKNIGVTGTNGKTTITYIIENILKCAGEASGVIGTINYRIKDKIIPAKNTTPGPLELQAMLAGMVEQSVGFAVMEVSSHSLDQHRVDGVLFDTAVFTNITSEHLDYHKTPENYLKAKIKLFDKLKTNGVAILNNDDKKVAALKKSIKNKVLTYGIREKADVTCKDPKLSLDGSGFIVTAPGVSFKVNTKLIGLHNVSNILAAISACIALGIDPKAIEKGVNTARFAPGRLEPVNEAQPFKVFVDYAHTEDALRNVLGLLKGTAEKRIITVFGCGGNRDRTKRPLMGIAACELSDRAVITSDNPRFEDPTVIIGEIESGIKGKCSNYDIVIDRREAIGRAFELASPGDVVLIAGKGHEDYQIIKDDVIAFDDRVVAAEILRKMYKNESKRNSKNNAREAAVR